MSAARPDDPPQRAVDPDARDGEAPPKPVASASSATGEGQPNERMPVVVTAAVIERDDAFLVTRRPRGVHLEGCWEFPGGKCERGESHESCLEREILEELGAVVLIGQRILAVSHEYAERSVELHFFRCTLTGDPRPLLGQEMRWVPRQELGALDFPPADAELIARLQRAGDASG